MPVAFCAIPGPGERVAWRRQVAVDSFLWRCLGFVFLGTRSGIVFQGLLVQEAQSL